jgi:cation diffusion facilitator CzcD-associated flavoprotein CzcO
MVRPNVEVVTAPIERIAAEGVQTGDGRLREVEAIIFATGFRVHDYLAPMRVTGLGGKDLNDTWRKGAEAYLGITVTGFPNFFMLYGPNTNAVTSIIFMLECQARYIVACIRKLENNRARYMNVRADTQQRFIADVRKRLSRTVPAMAGCLTYFKNEYGVIDTNWPGYTTEYGWRTRRVRSSDYDFAAERAV